MQVELVAMAQELDLSTGDVTHFVMIRLPSGATVKALVTDQSAKQIVETQIQVGPTTQHPEPRATQSYVPETIPEETVIFGDADPLPMPSPVPSTEPAVPLPRQKVVRVESDSYGYPIVRTTNGVDPRTLTGGHDKDEDGVGQL